VATYQDLFLDIRQKLRAAGVEAVDLHARELIAFASGKTTDAVIRDKALFATSDIVSRAHEVCDRRVSGEPLAYILGEWDFYGVNLKITPDVLIPRMDTEVLVDWSANVIKEKFGGKFRFLDLCSGSGCIGLALAKAFPESRGIMADVSKKAVELAAENAKRLDLHRRVIAVEGDVLAPPNKTFLGSFDAILSNPPYITGEEMKELDPSVVNFEPQGALFGGEDGFKFYRAIVEGWLPQILRPGGFIAFECGYRQAHELGALLKQHGYENIKIVEDTAGIARVVSAFAPPVENTNEVSEGNQDEC